MCRPGTPGWSAAVSGVEQAVSGLAGVVVSRVRRKSGGVPTIPEAGWRRGTGEPAGVARQALDTPIETLSGTIKAIKIGRCEKTTGRSLEGAHLIVQTPEGKLINLHLGPTFALREELRQLSVGQDISFEAFRTSRIPRSICRRM